MDFKNLTQQQKQHFWNILAQLSHRERVCYLSHVVNLWSFSEIASELGISKSSVQTYIERAREKIKQITENT